MGELIQLLDTGKASRCIRFYNRQQSVIKKTPVLIIVDALIVSKRNYEYLAMGR